MPEKLHIQKKNVRHEHKNGHHHHEESRRAGEKAKDTPGIICVERNIHDGAVVISGTLTLEYDKADIKAWIAGELEKAAAAVKEREGLVGHIKAAVTTTTTDVVSVTDEQATATESQRKLARIALAAIVFLIEPKEAENIIRKALAGVRARLREEADDFNETEG